MTYWWFTRVATVACCAVAVCGKCQAGIRPSFYLDAVAWEATDIFIASEGEKVDGNLTVTAVWDGNLVVGDSVSVPELASFATEASRTVKPFWEQKDNDAPVVVSAQRMVLFLKAAKEKNSPRERIWHPAAPEGVNVSVAWISNGHVYAFVQVMNPGPSVLVEQRFSEAEMKEKVAGIVKVRKILCEIAGMEDAKDRAKKAAEYLAFPNAQARREASKILGTCGKDGLSVLLDILRDDTRSELHRGAVRVIARDASSALRDSGKDALPVLTNILRNQSKLSLHEDVITAMGFVGGKTVASDLTALVGKELTFWREVAPGLKRGWWNGTGTEFEILRDRYSVVKEAFYALRKLKPPECKASVTEFRDFWRSLPQLEDKSGLDQMSQACDAVLKALPEELSFPEDDEE